MVISIWKIWLANYQSQQSTLNYQSCYGNANTQRPLVSSLLMKSIETASEVKPELKSLDPTAAVSSHNQLCKDYPTTIID